VLFSLCFAYRQLHKIFVRRYDGSPALDYWRASSFDVQEERFSFYSGKHLLSGSRYFKEGIKPLAVIIFFHGLGDGRCSYIKEICMLANAGYLIYAYDNTGSMESEGKKIYSLDHALRDQKAFFAFLDKEERAKGYKRYAIGHSWGGFLSLMSADNNYHIEKIISLSGYVSFLENIMSHVSRKLRFLRPAFWLALRLYEPRYGAASVYRKIRKTTAKVLYIQGDQDKIVPLGAGYVALRKKLKTVSNIRYLLVEGSSHSVFRASASEEYVHRLLQAGIEDPMENVLDKLDLEKATQENEEVWKVIFDFFRN